MKKEIDLTRRDERESFVKTAKQGGSRNDRQKSGEF